MADPQTADQGFLAGLLGKFGADPAAAYGGLLSDPATQRQFALRSLGAAAQAFGQGAMPVPYKGGIPFGATLGAAGGAASTAGDELIKARLEQAQADLAQQQGLLAHANVQGLAMNNSLYPVALGLDGKGGTGTGTDGKLLTGPAAIIAGKGKAVSSTTADTSLPLEARALLDTISGPESGGAYNVRWGGPNNTDVTFDDFSKHPNIPEPGPAGPSTAAGRYQIVNSTWKPLQAKYGFGDFSPATQDQAAWHLAADTYKEQTGRDLLTDLQAGKTDQVASALHGQWSTLHMGNYAANLGKYQGGGASPQTASVGDQPPAAAPGSQVGPYAPVPGQPGPQGVYVPPGASPNAPPVRIEGGPPAPAAPPGGLLKLPDPTSAAPPQLLTPPAAGAPGPVTGLLGQQPAQQVAAADAPQLSPAAAAVLQGINRQQAGGGLLASGSVAGGNAVPTGGPSPAAVAQAGPPHTGAAGAAELAGLLAQQPPPQAPAAGPVPPAAAPAPAPAPAGPMPPAPGGAPPPGVAPPMPPPAMPPMPPQPVAPVAAPGPIAGAPTDRQVAAASIIAHNNIMMGKAVPPDIAAILNYKYAGPTAAATAAATAPITQANAAYEAQVKAQYDLWVKQSAPRDIRKGGISEDPITHQTLINPDTVRRTDPNTGNQYDYYSYPSLTGGAPTLVPIGLAMLGPGAVETLKNTAGAQPIQVANQVTQQGPGYSQPIKTPEGSIIPDAAGAAPISGPKGYLDKRNEQIADAENAWGKSVAPANEAVQRMNAIMEAMKEYNSGTGATLSSKVVGMLKAAHIDLGDTVNDPALAQIILKNNFGSAVQLMQSTGLSKWTQAELFGQTENLANPELWPKANRAIGAQTIGTLQWEQQMQKDYTTFKKYTPMADPQDFQRRWVEANPLQGYVDRAAAQIGPLKGEAPATGGRSVSPLPTDLPPGSAYIGTQNGKPVYQLPNGQKVSK